MSYPKNAILLVAGKGSRLEPYTDDRPKCFVEVNGKPIIINMLDCLVNTECKRVIIVVGYMQNYILKNLGFLYKGMEIDYIINKDYAVTNSMYSLYLALKHDDFSEDTWVIEGDIFIKTHMLRDIWKNHIPRAINWFVDSSAKNMDGCFLTSNKEKIITSVDIIRGDLSGLKSNQSKSVGMLMLTYAGIRALRTWLAEGIDNKRVNDYYDLIIKDNLDKLPVGAVNIAGYNWFEIDTPEDLQEAEKIFS